MCLKADIPGQASFAMKGLMGSVIFERRWTYRRRRADHFYSRRHSGSASHATEHAEEPYLPGEQRSDNYYPDVTLKIV